MRVLVRPSHAAPPGAPPDALAYNAAVHAWCSAGQPAEGERLVAAMRAAGVSPTDSTYVELLAALAAAGRVPRAEQLLVRAALRGAPRAPIRAGPFLAIHAHFSD